MNRLLLLFTLIQVSFSSVGQADEKLYEKFERLQSRGKTKQAEKVMLQISSENAEFFDLLFEKASAFADQNQLDSAEKCISFAINVFASIPMPSSEEFMKRRETHYQNGVLIMDKIVLKDSLAHDFFTRGNMKKDIGLKNEAISDYTIAIKRDPENPYYYFGRGLTFHEINELDSAISDYTNALKLNPKEATFYLNRGFVLLSTEQYDKAIYDFERATRYTDEVISIAFAFSNMGYAYLQLGKLELAEEKVLYSLNLFPTNNYAYRNLALIKIEQKDLEKACEYIAKSLELGFTYSYGDEVQKLQEKHCKP